MIWLGVTLEPMYKFKATAHALSASVSIWRFLSKSRGGKTTQTDRKTNVESPGQKIMYVKIKPRSFGIIHNLPLNLALLPCLTHSLGGLTSLLLSSTPCTALPCIIG